MYVTLDETKRTFQCQMLDASLTAAASERSCPAVPLTMLRPGVSLRPPPQVCSESSSSSRSSTALLPALDLAEVWTELWREAPGPLWRGLWPLLCGASPTAIFTSWLPEPRMSCLQQPSTGQDECLHRSCIHDEPRWGRGPPLRATPRGHLHGPLA